MLEEIQPLRRRFVGVWEIGVLLVDRHNDIAIQQGLDRLLLVYEDPKKFTIEQQLVVEELQRLSAHAIDRLRPLWVAAKGLGLRLFIHGQKAGHLDGRAWGSGTRLVIVGDLLNQSIWDIN